MDGEVLVGADGEREIVTTLGVRCCRSRAWGVADVRLGIGELEIDGW